MKLNNTSCPEIRLKRALKRPGRSNAGRLHPWIFSGSIASDPEIARAGAVVKVLDSCGDFVGYGHYNPSSSIRIRLLSQDEECFPDMAFFEKRIIDAYNRRESLLIDSDSRRIVFSESDGMPGLVLDKFGDCGVMQTTTAGMDAMRFDLARMAMKICNLRSVVERNDCEIRGLENLPLRLGLLAGEPPPKEIVIRENGLKFIVNPSSGQKTGFYLDQRANRASVAKFVRPGMAVLDAFCFTGAFSVYCASRGASDLTLLDDSAEALEAAGKNLEINGAASNLEFHKGDAFSILRRFRDANRSFDMIILDPPKFAPTRRDADKARRGYKDINLLAMKLLRKGGCLATFSCSSGMPRQRFMEILRIAASDSGREFVQLDVLGQGPDHPVLLSFPESEYLKGFICKAIE